MSERMQGAMLCLIIYTLIFSFIAAIYSMKTYNNIKNETFQVRCR